MNAINSTILLPLVNQYGETTRDKIHPTSSSTSRGAEIRINLSRSPHEFPTGARALYSQRIEPIEQSSSALFLDLLVSDRRKEVAKNKAAIQLLESWINSDPKPEPNDNSLELLQEALDISRLSNRKLFPK